jgi:two-component system alkaline phosphatase synthesis response regulator PhoP
LIVDDDPDMVLLLETTLRADGIRVITAEGGESALRQIREKRPSLVLLDMQLPDVDGMKVCKTLRDEVDPGLRDIPVLILTGLKLTEADLIDAFVAGATDYLTKPIKPTMVRSRVRGWLLRTASPGTSIEEPFK